MKKIILILEAFFMLPLFMVLIGSAAWWDWFRGEWQGIEKGYKNKKK